jgi:acetyl-CoA carboxylase biotin carboxyl carrier protein
VGERQPEIDWSDQPGGDPDVAEKLTLLADAIAGTTVTEIELRDGDRVLRLRRRAQQGVPAVPHLAAAPETPPAEEPRDPAEATIGVMSPLAGVFYASPSPTSPPFVQVGETVSVGQVVCIVEAMKVFNEIKAEVGGTVVEIPPKNGQLVKKGDPLVRLRPF